MVIAVGRRLERSLKSHARSDSDDPKTEPALGSELWASYFSFTRMVAEVRQPLKIPLKLGRFSSKIPTKRLEARVGIEGRPPSALPLRAQFRPDDTGC
jgi:hypothetical protein